MGLILGLFKTPRHRVFNYRPLYYDERKEALDEKIENARKKENREYVPGESIKGSFKRQRYDVKRSSMNNPIRRFITLVALAVFMMALVYMAQYLGLLF